LQLGRLARQLAALQVSRRGNQVAHALAQPGGDDTRVLQVAKPDRDIDILGNEVEESVGDVQVDADPGAVRRSSDTPRCDSSTERRRLTVEIGIPSERAARLMLSNCATFTKIRMLSRSAIIIVTGASQGIGSAVANLFLDRGYNVVGNSRNISAKNELKRSDNLALVDGDIGQLATAQRVIATAVDRFGSVDGLVNNAGIFFAKPFVEYTQEDFDRLRSTNLDGFIHTTQLAVKQMLAQKTGGSIVSITTSIVDHPLAAFTASFPMITKGGINAASRSLAMEYAKQGIRVNVVAPGIVDTPLHKNNPKDFLRTLSPLGEIADARNIAEAVLYLTQARQVTGEILHVDGGSHMGRW
jgi:NAD(P)-dependent dehydrogenase (short-subunit alcohol dehydrogenase family)